MRHCGPWASSYSYHSFLSPISYITFYPIIPSSLPFILSFLPLSYFLLFSYLSYQSSSLPFLIFFVLSFLPLSQFLSFFYYPIISSCLPFLIIFLVSYQFFLLLSFSNLSYHSLLSPFSYISFYPIIKVAGSQDRHKRSDEFDFGPDQTTHYGVTCPWMTKILHFRTWISLRPVCQSWSNFMCSITGVGKGCVMFWGRFDQNSGVHDNRNPLLTYNGEKGVSTFSGK